jgi:hypothetical protein
MILDKKELRYKRYIQLQKESRKNWEAQNALGRVELENPRPNGWNVLIIPRQDVQNREDADVFWEIISICGRKGFVRDKRWYFSRKEKYSTYPYRPELRKIPDYIYNGLRPAVKKYFSKEYKRHYWYTNYYCNLPNFFWETKLERNYITHVQVIDEILKQEAAEIKKELDYLSDKWGIGKWHTNAPKSYCKAYNRSDRAHNKQALYNFLYKDMEENFIYNHRNSATWDYW